METFLTSIAVAVVTAILTVLLPKLLDRKWKKEDKSQENTEAMQKQIKVLVDAQKVIMQDRVRYLGKKYTADGHLSIADREGLEDMYSSYKALGGNGHLTPTMEAVRSLPLSSE